MADDLLSFQWEVPDGLKWIERDEDEWLLTTGLADGVGPIRRTYNPLEWVTAPLFRRFAELATDRGSILSFASQFGRLGGPLETGLPAEGTFYLGEGRKREPIFLQARADRYDLWIQSIERMRRLVSLWEAAGSARDTVSQSLAHVFNWERPDRVVYVDPNHGRRRIIAAGGDPAEAVHPERLRLHLFKTGDLRGPALQEVSEDVSSVLEDLVAPQLQWDDRGTRLRFVVVPNSLLGALWLQFAQAISADSRFRQCEGPGCTNWIEIHPSRNQRNRKTCSNACRQRLSRSNREDMGTAVGRRGKE